MSEQEQRQQAQQEQQRPSSFRDRTLDRLGGEAKPRRDEANFDGPGENLHAQEQPEQQVDVDEVQGEPVHADQPEDNHAQESVQPEMDTDQPGDELPEGVEPYVEGEDEPTELFVLRQRAEEAESKTLSMQQDYTQKTQEIGDTRRELTNSLDQSARIAQVYVDRASASLQRYDQVNWQQLQTQLPPDKYQAEINKYHQTVALRDRAVQEHQAIDKFATEQMEKRKQSESEHSRDVLRHAIPNWGNDLYGTIREYASQWDFSVSEIDQVTDHRVIRLLHNAWKMTQTGKKIQNIQQHGTQARSPGGPNKPAVRGANGRFRKAEEAHHANPGNRDLTREHFRQKLRNERQR